MKRVFFYNDFQRLPVVVGQSVQGKSRDAAQQQNFFHDRNASDTITIRDISMNSDDNGFPLLAVRNLNFHRVFDEFSVRFLKWRRWYWKKEIS